jgi:glutamyl-tRNA synthetase
MIIDVGTKSNDVTLSWENLFSYNRKILDATSNRYFFVADPIHLKVRNVPRTFNVKLPLHPEKPERGFREYTVGSEQDNVVVFWVARKDVANMELGKVIRLMELFNIKINEISDSAKEGPYTSSSWIDASFVSESYEEVRKAKTQLIHWIPEGKEYPCQVVMPDNTKNKGLAEIACKKLKPDAIIQFERYGFVRINEAGEKLVAYYAHK